MKKVILVTGATGRQGMAIIAQLCDSPGVQLLGLTRNTASTASSRLAARYPSLELVSGNLKNANAIFAAAGRPIWGVYSVSPSMVSGFDPAEEERQGRQLIDAAIQNGVRHFVLSSVDRHGSRSDENETNVPHFQSKFRLEKYLQQQVGDLCLQPYEGRMKYTILRLPCFMENLTLGFMGRFGATAWKLSLDRDKKMQLISVKDIARYADGAFNQGQHVNKAISIAGDELTFAEANAIFHRRFKRNLPTTYEFLVKMVLWWIPELGRMMAWFNEVGCAADIAALREEVGDLINFETWLESSCFSH